MTKRETALQMLDQLEEIMIKVETYEQFNVKNWLALARVVYFLLKEYIVSTERKN